MALTPSTMLELGTPAPDFSLPDTEGNPIRRDEVRGEKGLLVMFLSNHCPYVKHIRTALASVTREIRESGVGVVAVNANDVTQYPADSLPRMAEEKKSAGYSFPYCFDESQKIAQAYRAACTPDFFLFDGELRLVYRGQFDDSRPGNGIPATGADLMAAVKKLVAGEKIPADQRPSIGCNIKWKPGNEPAYFG